METVLITGASGLIGNRLTHLLQEKGYRVVHLSRATPKNSRIETFLWDVEKQTMDEMAIQCADHIVHLAGTGIADKRWTPSRKKEIINSRVESIHLLFKTIQKTGKKINTFVSASGVGFYGGITSEIIFSENDLPATDFLGTTCKLWEEAAEAITRLEIRTVKLRIGVVLSEKGGALKKMSGPIQFFVGAPLGNGKQYMPWIHLDDLCTIFIKAIEDHSMQGAYNAVAPEHITNKQFTKAIADVLHRPLFMPNVPSALLRLVMGELSVAILKGSRVSCEKIKATGFLFEYDKLGKALKSLFRKEKK